MSKKGNETESVLFQCDYNNSVTGDIISDFLTSSSFSKRIICYLKHKTNTTCHSYRYCCYDEAHVPCFNVLVIRKTVIFLFLCPIYLLGIRVLGLRTTNVTVFRISSSSLQLVKGFSCSSNL